MSADSPTNLAKRLFLEAIDLEEPQRRAYLTQLRERDPEAHQRVSALLEAHEGASESGLDELEGQFRAMILGASAEGRESWQGEPTASREDGLAMEGALPRLGDYELTAEIAAGGAGVVYRARQVSLGRDVAVKLLRAGRFASEAEVERFRAEAEVVARLDHPRIVPIYEVGTCEGRHFFSMKLVEGGNLAAALASLVGDFDRSATLLAQVARAVHHGHQRGLLHRDLKPSNILLDEAGEPYVADFGIAKSLDADRQAGASGWYAGTPTYMAPEQTEKADLTVGADIYALGCILYELLAGRPPFAADSLAELFLAVRNQSPPPIGGAVPHDLETVARKCLEKEPQHRYVSAAALAVDLERWSRREPILAVRSGVLRRVQLFARRKPLVATLAALTAALTLALALGGTWASFALQRRLNDARSSLRASYLAQSEALRSARPLGWRQASLQRLRSAADIEPGADLRDEVIACLAAPDLELRHRWALPTQESSVGGKLRVVAMEPEAGCILLRRGAGPDAQAGDELLEVIRIETGDVLQRWDDLPGAVIDASFAAGGRILAFVLARGEGRALRIHDLEREVVLRELTQPAPRFVHAFDDSGERLAFADEHGIQVIDLETGEVTSSAPVAGRLWRLAFDPSGQRVAFAGFSSSFVGVLSTESGDLIARIEPDVLVRDLAWTLEGRLAMACADFHVRLWDLDTVPPPVVSSGSELPEPGFPDAGIVTLKGHRSDVIRLGASRTQPTLFSYSWDSRSVVWNTFTEEPIGPFEGEVVAMSRDGERFLMQSPTEVTSRRLVQAETFEVLYGHEGKSPSSISLSPDGRLLASGGKDGAWLWDLESRAALRRLSSMTVGEVLFGEDGSGLYIVGGEGIQRLSLPSLHALRAGTPLEVTPLHTGIFRRAALTADGGVVAGRLDKAQLLQLSPQGEVRFTNGHASVDTVAQSANGRWQLMGTWGTRGVGVWDAHSGEQVRELLPEASSIMVFASPVDDFFVLCTRDEMRCLRFGTWETLWTLTQPPEVSERVGPACFTPDGRWLALSLARKEVLIVEPSTGRVRARLQQPGDYPVARMAFRGPRLAIATNSRRIFLWHLDALGDALDELEVEATQGGELFFE